MRLFIFLFLLIILNCTTSSTKIKESIEVNIKKTKKYNREHHTPNGFKNIYPALKRSFLKSFLWITGKIFLGEDKEKILPAEGVQILKKDIEKKISKYRFWWLGHSTVYIQSPEIAFITDPQFSKRASPISFIGPVRHAIIPIEIEDLPKLDIVLISHNHYDHLDEESVKRIYKKFNPIFLVPLKVGNLLREWDIQKVIEMDWWEYIQIFDLEIYSTPARHFSSRTLWDRNETLWSGWFVKDRKNQFSFYFAGDTGYESFFKDIRQEIGKPSLAILPIGAFEPRWFMQEMHVNPQEAFQAFLDLEAEHFLPIHWGTFYLAEEKMDLPPILLKKEFEERGSGNHKVYFIKIGENIEF